MAHGTLIQPAKLERGKEYHMAKGTIKKLMDRGFGFIKTGEREIFFHRNDVVGVEFNDLREGQEVEFEEGKDRDNRPKAVSVRLAGTQMPDAGGDTGNSY